MAFIKIFIFLLKKFEKVEKTGIIFTKFSLRCTPSVILGFQSKKKCQITVNLLQDSALAPFLEIGARLKTF